MLVNWRQHSKLLFRIVDFIYELFHNFEKSSKKITACDKTKQSRKHVKIPIRSLDNILNLASEQILFFPILSLAKNHHKTVLYG